MIDSVSGLRWMANGQAVLYGPLLALAERLDAHFLALASQWEAADHRFPPFISASVLERIDWFRSFPQLATFPACLDAEEANLARFTEGQPVADGVVRPTDLAPIRDVLTPAACYHLYDHHAGQRFDGPRYFTTRNTCFRREERYEPLERQWSFSMREIVCMGTAEETSTFLESATAEVNRFVARIGLPLRWEHANDPFFRPSRNPQYLMQQVDPTKFELLFEERLAIASTNLHHDHFGRAFDISRDGEPARTACIAFGIERWLSAFVHHFGAEGPWPS
ncbi:MAG: aminoacyl--tRNA ligase-related protein [Acidimicrobiales bacterium]